MKNHKRYKTILAVLCLLLISVSFTACNGKNDFYSGAKKLAELLDDHDTEVICGISSG